VLADRELVDLDLVPVRVRSLEPSERSSSTTLSEASSAWVQSAMVASSARVVF
jgi:hypothetical protein